MMRSRWGFGNKDTRPKSVPVGPVAKKCAGCGKPLDSKAFSRVDGKDYHHECEPEMTIDETDGY